MFLTCNTQVVSITRAGVCEFASVVGRRLQQGGLGGATCRIGRRDAGAERRQFGARCVHIGAEVGAAVQGGEHRRPRHPSRLDRGGVVPAADNPAFAVVAAPGQQGVAAVVCLNDGKEIASAGSSTAEADNFRKRAAVVLGHLKPVIAETGIEGTETFSMRSDNRHVVTYSFQGPTTLCVLHDSSHHDTGLPEKLTLIAREVAQILRETPPS